MTLEVRREGMKVQPQQILQSQPQFSVAYVVCQTVELHCTMIGHYE